MKKFVTSIFAFMLVAGLSAQVKKYVGIVREKHYQSVDEFLDELASSLRSRGHSSYANYVEAYREGGLVRALFMLIRMARTMSLQTDT